MLTTLLILSLCVLYYYSGETDSKGWDYFNKKNIYPKTSVEEYNREDWKHWIDEDKDGQDTRQEVLIEESLIPVTFGSNGKVIKGQWHCLFTDQYFTNPSGLDIDHFVPLKNAYDSGGKEWSSLKKMQYANDLNNKNHLIAVSKSANSSKGSKAPFEWLPTNKKYQCEYVCNWIEIKENWGLTVNRKTYFLTNTICNK